MTARLDHMKHYGDYAGKVSDPRLVRKVDAIPPHGPHISTPASQRAVLAAIANAVDTAGQAADAWDAMYAPLHPDPTYNNPFRTGQVPTDHTDPIEKDCE
ncbi:MAG: hypothetical protein ACTH32_06645 [Microbacterium gubbeenense]|uniref:hypothetical protein n=1 Tax=Microbacterium gubbeenense TaxID=159896 RepID=UPI003F958302